MGSFFLPADHFRFVLENNGWQWSVMTASPDVSGPSRLSAFTVALFIVVLYNTRSCRGQSLRGTMELQVVIVDGCQRAAGGNEPDLYHPVATGATVNQTLKFMLTLIEF